MSRHRWMGLVGVASALALLGSWAGGPLSLVVFPVVLTVPGYLVVTSVSDRHPGTARLKAWLAVPVSLALIVLLSLVSGLVAGSYRTWAVAGLLAGGTMLLARRLDRAAAAPPRVDHRLAVAGLAVAVVGATAFALTTIGSVIPDEAYLQVRFTGGAAPLGGSPARRTIGVDIVNHTAERSEVVVEAKWGRWTSGPATRVVPPTATTTSTIRLPATAPCRGTIVVTVTPAGGHPARMLTREVRPGDC